MSRPWIALKAIIYATLFLAIWGIRGISVPQA